MILVTGATGNVGGEVVRQLSAVSPAVRALTREPSGQPSAENVTWVSGDLAKPASLASALAGTRSVFLLGGQPDMPGILAEMRKASVAHVVLLSSRSVLIGHRANAIVKMWLDSEAAVRDSGLAWTMLRPSGFASNALRWKGQIQSGNLVRVPFARAAIASIDPADIAAVAVAALTSDAHRGQSHALSGPEAQLPETQVEILAGVLGKELRFEAQPDDEALAELRKSAPPGFAEAFESFYVKGEFDDSVVVPTVQELTGRAPRTFAEWATSNAARFS